MDKMSILKNVKTSSDVKRMLDSNSYFFSKETMRFFGDKMSSFGVRRIDGKLVMYRKPNAYVNVFGIIKRVGKNFFNCWEIVEKEGGYLDLIPVNKELEETVFLIVNTKYA